MIFHGIDNQTVELRITNYQFPNHDDGDWDSNWINIYLKVDSKLGKWQTIDPSLTTWEFKMLIDWFNQILEKEILPNDCDLLFTEPNLSFKIINKSSTAERYIRIGFNLESRPTSATVDSICFVDIQASNEELRRIVKELNHELEKFPERRPKK